MNGGVVAYYSERQMAVALCPAMEETTALPKFVLKVKHMRALFFLFTMLSGTRNTNQQHMCGLTIQH
jgi:hypothetical protein